ncbi:phosphate acetyltransferase [Cognatishimia activa]|uniref:Phosphate acetyltransferase n=1 Tax=Cognatishimia activa TaxID=1715691 RepID=A0A0P1J0F0_9RHOB|nr:phosphate acetyltransferase [Cognatishimia activa]CUI49698.1 Phosphate acetyltransferase [Cognatishimia activa]CUK27381.1 Phosphate acetyltransferase [Cognatishimia activa]
MTLLPQELLKSKAPSSRPVISLCEGSDPRIVAGALAAHQADLANVILVGDADAVRAELSSQGASESEGVQVHDPLTSPLTSKFAAEYHDLRKHKGVDEAKALTAVQTPVVYAAMLVRLGHATGTVGGAVLTTGDIVRSAIQVIGMHKDAAMVSSFFLMYPPKNATNGARAMLYSDCGLVIDPSAQELSEIAKASSKSCRALLETEPKIGFLSFSTKGSAKHTAVSKVAEGLALFKETAPDIEADGEFQFDAAFVPSVGERKAPGSSVAGHANVMIFPNLDAGNIGYKITQRLGGYMAIGPVMQGLAKPANDLSRGCIAEDVTEMIAVTALQSLNQ